MGDYMNYELAAMKYRDLVNECDDLRRMLNVRSEKRRMSEKLILRIADFMIDRGTKIRESVEDHHAYPALKRA